MEEICKPHNDKNFYLRQKVNIIHIGVGETQIIPGEVVKISFDNNGDPFLTTVRRLDIKDDIGSIMVKLNGQILGWNKASYVEQQDA